jgi:hypothetical protein
MRKFGSLEEGTIGSLIRGHSLVGERLLCKEEVRGSSPLGSTKLDKVRVLVIMARARCKQKYVKLFDGSNRIARGSDTFVASSNDLANVPGRFTSIER